MNITIKESNLEFGPFDTNEVFHIEKSEILFKHKNKFKLVEFLLINKKKLFFVEAKSSSPKLLENNNFITEVFEKFHYSLLFYLGIKLGRFTNDTDLSKIFKNRSLNDEELLFVLVIKGHKIDWLIPIKDELNKKMKSFFMAFNIKNSPILVLNENECAKLFPVNAID